MAIEKIHHKDFEKQNFYGNLKTKLNSDFME